jgi:hypothetical protein
LMPPRSLPFHGIGPAGSARLDSMEPQDDIQAKCYIGRVG